MNGWMGKILKIDLSTGKVETERTEAYVDDFLGGRGIGVRLVYELLKPGTDALAPGNPLIFSMGPLTGTAIPSSGRTDITALSPLSNLRAKSNFGAYWGPELKFCGYDHLMITGKADKPCYIWIKDGQVEIRTDCCGCRKNTGLLLMTGYCRRHRLALTCRYGSSSGR